MPLSWRRILQRRSQTVHVPPPVASITEENTGLSQKTSVSSDLVEDGTHTSSPFS